MYAVAPTTELDEILKLLRGWVRLLSCGDYTGASEYLFAAESAKKYDADTLVEAIGNYSPDFRLAPKSERRKYIPRVSDPSSVERSGENLVIYSRTPTGLAYLEYELPIAGAWSDLTASFFLVETSSGYAIALSDLHVL